MLSNEQLEKQLQVLTELKEVGTDEFFYTRLRAKMGKDIENTGWIFRLKPVWVMTVLLIMLAFNTWMLATKMQISETTSNTDSYASLALQYESNMVVNY
jgi:hypothetical protein